MSLKPMFSSSRNHDNHIQIHGYSIDWDRTISYLNNIIPLCLRNQFVMLLYGYFIYILAIPSWLRILLLPDLPSQLWLAPASGKWFGKCFEIFLSLNTGLLWCERSMRQQSHQLPTVPSWWSLSGTFPKHAGIVWGLTDCLPLNCIIIQNYSQKMTVFGLV